MLYGFAAGGRPSPGMPALVGERGSAVFVPDVAGRLVPNVALSKPGGDTRVYVTINAQTGASQIRGNDAPLSQLANRIGGLVRQVIIEEQRPGGLLSR